MKKCTVNFKNWTLSLLGTLVLVSCGPTKTTESKSSSVFKSFEVIADLDLEITETSGLEQYNARLLTHNDSDATPTVYFLDTKGKIEGSTTFSEMENVDWEDMTIGNESLYIADIGNNYGNRSDLTIYKIPVSSINDSQVQPEKIEFSYASQRNFERANQNHSYDGEALVYVNDELLLFSKDWVNFTTDVYRINDQLKNQKLERFQQLDVQGLVTGATFNGKDRIVLCGYNSGLEPFVAVISVNGGQLKLLERIALPLAGAQIEAITFYQNKNQEEIYYLTSEAVNIQLGEDEATSNGQLYKLTLKN